ncbi:hypothetical protein [Paenibacillus thermotolerans]|uniref:hypothetical protein n=1 Tax=Paenibacillus thermotolerans TaxID=3027807 RepID=UPI002368BF64|nr:MULTISPECIES: hypothetical protein [unclassified Paenibacillus]
MKRPKIKIFGQVYNVIQIEFDKNSGLIKKIVYQVNEHQNKSVFKSNEMISKSLTSKYKIQEPTVHPYHDYAYAPDLEALLVECKTI